jgi:hypothetical protein
MKERKKEKERKKDEEHLKVRTPTAERRGGSSERGS